MDPMWNASVSDQKSSMWQKRSLFDVARTKTSVVLSFARITEWHVDHLYMYRFQIFCKWILNKAFFWSFVIRERIRVILCSYLLTHTTLSWIFFYWKNTNHRIIMKNINTWRIKSYDVDFWSFFFITILRLSKDVHGSSSPRGVPIFIFQMLKLTRDRIGIPNGIAQLQKSVCLHSDLS